MKVSEKSYEKLFLLFILFLALFFSNNVIREGFFSPQYKDCIKSGFSKEFCVQTPVSAMGPGACECEPGVWGYQLPGFQGECVCQQSDIRYLNKLIAPSNDYPFELIGN